jgi:hypothetical protein
MTSTAIAESGTIGNNKVVSKAQANTTCPEVRSNFQAVIS